MRKNFSILLLSCFISIGNLWGTTYKLTQVFSSNEMIEGEKYVFERNSHVLNNNVSNNALQTTNVYKRTKLLGTETYIWTLESADGGFKLRNINRGNYSPYLHNESNNTTISFTASTTPATWEFSFTNGLALIQNVSNLLSIRFLGETDNNSYLYKAYSSSNLSTYGHDFTVYKLEAEPEYTLHDPALSLAAIDGAGAYWATFSDASNVTFFPSAHDTEQTTTIYKVNVDDGVMTLSALTPQDVTIENEIVNGYFIPANTGVLIKSTSASAPYYTVANVNVSALSNNMLYPGTGNQIDSPAPIANYYFLLLGYTDFSIKSTLGFYLQNQDGTVFTSRLGGAYLAVPKTEAAATAPGYRIINEEDNATHMERFQTNEFVQKFFVNGQLMICRDGYIYDVLGKRIN